MNKLSSSSTPIANLINAALPIENTTSLGELHAAAAGIRTALAALREPGVYATEAEVEAADDIHGTDEVEVDHYGNALVSHGDDGFWVSAWVWVPSDNKDENGKD